LSEWWISQRCQGLPIAQNGFAGEAVVSDEVWEVEEIANLLGSRRRISMASTTDVLNHHLKCFGANDLDGVLDDYSPDAVLFTPSGPLKGTDAIRPFFKTIIAEFAKPGCSFAMAQQHVDGDYAYIVWSAETADNSYEFGTDTFVVRSGKILAQSFGAVIKAK
jgi:ketosteroid isomerase-like protein